MKTVHGKVSRKSEGVDPVSGTFTVDIRPNVSLSRIVASGMFGKATITPSNGIRVWAIPYDALLDADGNTGYVFVTSNGETAEKIKVSIAAVNPGRVLIDGGLEGHTNLIISGSAYLSDQSPIKINP
jgi:multidrug efflux pump subunit AcrA (membrane-fusion protein)